MCSNAASFACGPYDVPNALIDSYVVYTDNPPCGAMRGFGAVQTCFAHEAQMDKLAAALDMDPVELRRRNALAEGGVIPTGATIRCPAPVDELLGERVGAAATRAVGDHARRPLEHHAWRGRPARGRLRGRLQERRLLRGVRRLLDGARTALAGGRRAAGRGATRRRPRSARGWSPCRSRSRATSSASSGCIVLPADTQVGSAGSSSASRQTYMTGGAVKLACEAVREELERRGGSLDEPIDITREHHHRPTQPLDDKGQGDAHVTFAFAAHRAVVDVDTELGLVRVVEIATAQDVGRAINPLAVEGQIEGGIAQGLGLALMEEIQVVDGAGPQRLVHRLPDPDRARHAAGRARRARAGRPGRAVRAARRRRAADHLLHPGDRRRPARGDGRAADPRAGPSRRHRGPVMPVPPAELTAEFSVAGPEAALAAARAVAGPRGWRARPAPASRR